MFIGVLLFSQGQKCLAQEFSCLTLTWFHMRVRQENSIMMHFLLTRIVRNLPAILHWWEWFMSKNIITLWPFYLHKITPFCELPWARMAATLYKRLKKSMVCLHISWQSLTSLWACTMRMCFPSQNVLQIAKTWREKSQSSLPCSQEETGKRFGHQHSSSRLLTRLSIG